MIRSRYTQSLQRVQSEDTKSYLLFPINYIRPLAKRVTVVQCVQTARLLQISARPPPNKFWPN